MELTMRGFRSHEHETSLSFEGRSLLAIVGPTGAGKSSILDAISFALYGRTPKLAPGFVKKLVCSRSESAHVRLRFTSDADEYEITRTIRSSGSGEHLLVDRSSGDKIIGRNPVTARIEELLSLDFDGFCSSVMLAQNKFSQFLDATQTTRMQILKGVFRLEQLDVVREAAKRTSHRLEGDLREIEGARSLIPEDAGAQLDDARRDASEATARAGMLQAALPEQRRLTDAVREADAALEQGRRAEASARDARARIPAPEALRALVEEDGEIAGPLDDARERLGRAEEEKAAATEQLEALEARLGRDSDLVHASFQVKERARAVEGLRGVEEQRARLATRIEGLRGAREAAAAAELEAAGAVEAWQEERRAMERAHSAHALRATLVTGEPCPVCAQDVRAVPAGAAPPELAGVEEREPALRAAESQARRVASEAAAALTAGEQEERGLEARGAELTLDISKLDSALANVLGHPDDAAREVKSRLERLASSKTRIDNASRMIDALREEVDRWIEARARFEDRRRGFVAELIMVAGSMSLEPPALESGAGTLIERADDIARAVEDALEQSLKATAEATSARDDAVAALSALHESLGLGAEAAIESALQEAAERRAGAATRAADLEGKIALAAELDLRNKDTRARHGIFVQLSEDLTDRNFIKFLLEDKRRLLSDLGSERLREMTGRYRFDDRGEFNVVDELDADKHRTVDTLSGGETFLASLALSLGLADAVTRHGGRLNCFFLDEGFGSLDPESLDLALDGIERIVSENRLIGLVSHVAALAARVEDRIELDKGTDGMSIVKKGAGLG